MLVSKCVERHCFDMASYVSASKHLNITGYIWCPPGEHRLRLDTFRPVGQTVDSWKQVISLFKWADDTDPGRVIRSAYVKKVWAERKAGVEIIYLN
jgi:hypothetical protein